MTGDKVFYKQVLNDVKTVKGKGYLEPKPLKMELEEVRIRIGNMEKALEKEENKADKKRLKMAIDLHLEEEERLLSLIRQMRE